MCIAAVAFQASPHFPLIFAANRDELHARPTATADWWPDAPDVLGGRDLVAGGSWLAVNRAGWLAAVTNLPAPPAAAALQSRGALVREFLTGDRTAEAFLETLAQRARDYAPFNFLGFDGERLYYFGTDAGALVLEPGVHALSNAPWNTRWPKLATARDGLRQTLGMTDPVPALFSLLAQGADQKRPARSADTTWRKNRLFIRDPEHGTRASTVVALAGNGHIRFMERGFDANGELCSSAEHEFTLHAQ